jgi:GntR family transcriptional regulator
MDATAGADLAQVSVDRRHGLPLYLQLSEQIAELIEREELPAGAPLPSESELQRRFRVSRATVRHGLQQLALRGVVERHQGRGTFVALPQLERALHELTGFSEHLASKGLAHSSELVSYRRLVDEDDARAGISPDAPSPALLGEGEPLVEIVRVRRAGDVAVGIHTTLLREAVAERIGFTEARLRHDRSLSFYALLERAGIVLAGAEEHLRARIASPAEARLLDARRGAAVISVLRLSHDAARRRVEAVRAVYLGDKYDYVINLKRGSRSGRRRSKHE